MGMEKPHDEKLAEANATKPEGSTETIVTPTEAATTATAEVSVAVEEPKAE